MFEIIYIAPTNKSAARFIRDIVDRLKNLEIEDFKTDMKHMQIRTEKYVIIGISLSGSMLGVGRRNVKYYIDGIANPWDYESNRNFEKIIERLEMLIQSFHRRAKEISVDEMIDILQEG